MYCSNYQCQKARISDLTSPPMAPEPSPASPSTNPYQCQEARLGGLSCRTHCVRASSSYVFVLFAKTVVARCYQNWTLLLTADRPQYFQSVWCQTQSYNSLLRSSRAVQNVELSVSFELMRTSPIQLEWLGALTPTFLFHESFGVFNMFLNLNFFPEWIRKL